MIYHKNIIDIKGRNKIVKSFLSPSDSNNNSKNEVDKKISA